MSDDKKQVQRGKRTPPIRLWVRGIFTGFRRSKVKQNCNQALIKIEGLEDRKNAAYYFGKKVAYIYKATNIKNNTKFRVIWGKITTNHGNNGVVLARFRKNLPAIAMGRQVRVMLYPNRFQANFKEARCTQGQ